MQHFVLISVLGVDRDYEDAPVFKAKRAVEQYLVTSGLNYTIFRPSGLASNLLPLAESFQRTGLYLLIGDRKSRTSIVSPDDLAKMVIDCVNIAAAENQIFPVGGPDILMREDIPLILGRIFNREPIIINPPLLILDGLRSALGLFNPEEQQNLGTFCTLLANEFFCTPEEITNLESIFNFKLERLENFLSRHLAV